MNNLILIGTVLTAFLASSSVAQEVSAPSGRVVCLGTSCPQGSGSTFLVDSQCLLSGTSPGKVDILRQEMKRASALLRQANTLEEANQYMSALLSANQELPIDFQKKYIPVRTVFLAEKFYALLQKAWYFGIKYGDLEIGINPVIDIYNQNAGQEITGRLAPVRTVDGVAYVGRKDYLAAIKDMKIFISRILFEGSMADSEFRLYKKFRAQQILESHPWEARIADNNMLKKWAVTYPRLAQREKGLFGFNEDKAKLFNPSMKDVFSALGSIRNSPISGC